MLKVRITFPDTEKGNAELDELVKLLERKMDLLATIEKYKGRGKSLYSNIYLDVQSREQ